MVILSADDWACIFVLFICFIFTCFLFVICIVYCLDEVSCTGASGGWVMPGLVFKWFPLCESSLFDTP